MYSVARAMPSAAEEVSDAGGAAERAATKVTMSAVGAQLAAVCDMIEEHRSTWTPISGRSAATISAMIDDLGALAAEGKPRAGRRKRRMGNACRYHEVRRLGEGQFGMVTEARHRATGQVVAVKSLKRRSTMYDNTYICNLLREACFMAACRGQPSIVTLHSVARTPGTRDYSLVMYYVGPSLLDLMLRRGGRPFPEADVRRMMRQLLAGAEWMHRHGIVHRDIKPGNILVGGDGGAATPKICDFGVAKYVGELDPRGYANGTIGYMAPEVLVWNPDHDTLVDSWSLGCVMAQLIAGGASPFHAEDMTGSLYKIFDVLGVPGKRAWQALKPDEDLADEVQQLRARQRRVGHRNRLRDLFPEEVLSKDGFEVLKGLLTCDPKKRLTAAAALRCRWFTGSVDDDDPPSVDGKDGAMDTGSVDDDDPLGVVSKDGAMMATGLWSQAMACVGRAIGLLRPKALLNLIM